MSILPTPFESSQKKGIWTTSGPFYPCLGNMDHFLNIEIRTLWVFNIEIRTLLVIRTGPYFKISSGPYSKVQIFWRPF